MISFDNTEIAFRSKNKQDLQRAYLLFKIIGWPRLVKMAKLLTPLALQMKLPIKGLIKKTIFKQFCGGETIQECDHTIESLHAFGIGTILDYSVEGKTQEHDFEQTTQIIIQTIEKSATDVCHVTATSKEPMLVRLFDQQGSCLESFILQETHELDLRNYAAGIYFLETNGAYLKLLKQ